jgi:16S rRNA (cytosine967-C5)-methyltransferase
VKPGARVDFLITLLAQYLEKKGPADAFISSMYKNHRFIGSKDRQFFNTHFFNILRHILALQHIFEESPRLWVIGYFHIMENMVLKDLEAFFNDDPYHSASLSGEELGTLKKAASDYHSPALPFWIKRNIPQWLYEECRFIEEHERMFECFQKEAPLDIRINPLKSTPCEVMALFKDTYPDVRIEKISSRLPFALRLNRRVALSQMETYKQGWFEIQDAGSQHIARHMEAKAGEHILDFCAGACGKTLAFASNMQGKGRIICTDVFEKRLINGKKRLKRAGIQNAECRLLNGSNDPWLKRQKKRFDAVLVDAPCSGTGTLRRNPDKVLNMIPLMVEGLVEQQRFILKKAAECVKPGGRLLYATCSILKKENEEQISAFLKDHDDFSPAPLNEFTSHESSDVYEKTYYPHTDGCDGFYVAKIIRKTEK